MNIGGNWLCGFQNHRIVCTCVRGVDAGPIKEPCFHKPAFFAMGSGPMALIGFSLDRSHRGLSNEYRFAEVRSLLSFSQAKIFRPVKTAKTVPTGRDRSDRSDRSTGRKPTKVGFAFSSKFPHLNCYLASYQFMIHVFHQ